MDSYLKEVGQEDTTSIMNDQQTSKTNRQRARPHVEALRHTMMREVFCIIAFVSLAFLVLGHEVIAAVVFCAGIVYVLVHGMVIRDEPMPSWMQGIFKWRPLRPPGNPLDP